MEIIDDKIPSSNAIMAEVLYKWEVYFENESYIKKSELMIKGVAGKTVSAASYYSQYAGLAGLLTSGTYEIAVLGQDAINKNIKLQNNYLPGYLYGQQKY